MQIYPRNPLHAKLFELVSRTLPRGGAHSIDHVARVYELCMWMGEKLGANLEELGIAAILHDIARHASPDHARDSAKEAKRILEELSYPKDKIERVAHAIEAHSFSSGVAPQTLEAKILSDADKIDAMGAIGIFRACVYAAERGMGLEAVQKHLEEKLLKLKDLMQTELGKSLAQERHEVLEAFYLQLRRELSQE